MPVLPVEPVPVPVPVPVVVDEEIGMYTRWSGSRVSLIGIDVASDRELPPRASDNAPGVALADEPPGAVAFEPDPAAWPELAAAFPPPAEPELAPDPPPPPLTPRLQPGRRSRR